VQNEHEGSIEIKWDEMSSHSCVLKQLIDGLVKNGFASRTEIEEEFVSLLETGVYKTNA
jgi:hypothetical protein